MNDTELLERRKLRNQGYEVIKNGAPDFLAVKFDENKNIIGVKFREVKAKSDTIKSNQKMWGEALKFLNADYKVSGYDLNSHKVKVCNETCNMTLEEHKKLGLILAAIDDKLCDLICDFENVNGKTKSFGMIQLLESVKENLLEFRSTSENVFLVNCKDIRGQPLLNIYFPDPEDRKRVFNDDFKGGFRADRCIMLSHPIPITPPEGYKQEVDSMKEHIGEYFPSKFLKAEDIKGDLTLTIKGLEEEPVGKDETKPVMRFVEIDKGFVVNKTNSAAITSILGTDLLAEWIGKQITLFKTTVPFGNEMKPAIRVRYPEPAQAADPGASAPAASSLIEQKFEEGGKT